MITLDRISDLRQQVSKWRRSGQKIAFVPTMGNLHQGHLDLVKKAQSLADRVVVSIFVNPLQFGVGEDFESYPRTEVEDSEKLAALGTDLLFTPTVEEVYPRPRDVQTRVEVPGISDILCGASRPGHFVGVATVVCKLFNMVLPDVAVFGEKDFQQLMVIRLVAQDLCIPVEIVGLATVRESDGLARSSRNGYLSDDERDRAPNLYRVLQETASRLSSGERDFESLKQRACQELEQCGFGPDYFEIRRRTDLLAAEKTDTRLVILAAAQLGRARLIDNLVVDLDGKVRS